MEAFSNILTTIDNFVWGPFMLTFLMGTSIFLTIRTRALCWRNLPYALGSVLSKEAREKKGDGDVSPFSALTTALAATIGTGNIVGVATAMVSGGPGALIWMWISAVFGLTSKFSECMLAIKYREVNEKGEMSGGPMYTMKKGFKNKKLGAILGWLFAFFAVIASFGIGNMTQANSISTALSTTFHIPLKVTGIAIMILTLVIVIGGIKAISKVSQIVVPVMAVFYMIAGFIIILGNIQNVPEGIAMIFKMAFSFEALGGGLCGSLVASMTQALRFGVARGIFSNEAGMGSAAITAAAATSTDPVQQGYINMTGTFWDTIVVCTITGLCIACSGLLGTTTTAATGTYSASDKTRSVCISSTANDKTTTTSYDISFSENNEWILTPNNSEGEPLVLTAQGDYKDVPLTLSSAIIPASHWKDAEGNDYIFGENNTFEYKELLTGSALTIAVFENVLGKTGGWLLCISIAFFAFSTILGWEYNGEKAFEYILGTHKFNMVYRILFAVVVYLGATTSLEIAWTFSDIANALMAIPNLICLLALSGVVAKEITRYQKDVIKKSATKKR